MKLTTMIAAVLVLLTTGCASLSTESSLTPHERAVAQGKSELSRVQEANERARIVANMQNRAR